MVTAYGIKKQRIFWEKGIVAVAEKLGRIARYNKCLYHL